jgi:hypothetical protein
MKNYSGLCIALALVVTTAGCSAQPQPSKPKFFGDDCEKIASKIRESAEIDKDLINFYITKNQFEARHRKVLNYYRSYLKARKGNLSRDQKLFIADIKDDQVTSINWTK